MGGSILKRGRVPGTRPPYPSLIPFTIQPHCICPVLSHQDTQGVSCQRASGASEPAMGPHLARRKGPKVPFCCQIWKRLAFCRLWYSGHAACVEPAWVNKFLLHELHNLHNYTAEGMTIFGPVPKITSQ